MLPPDIRAALVAGHLADPFAHLGLHAVAGVVEARIWRRHAVAVALRAADGSLELPLTRTADGLFEGRVDGRVQPFAYEIEVRDADGALSRTRDPYAFWPLLSDYDLDLFRAGHHLHLGDVLGAHACIIDGAAGVRFAVWAPNASRVSVVGDWNGFDGRWHPMRRRSPAGVWELFIPGLGPGERYKYEVRTADGALRVKADPFAGQAEVPPATASIVAAPDAYAWGDAEWLEQRGAVDHLVRPLAVYEVHLGSWRRGAVGAAERWPDYRALAAQLVPYVKELGFTHIELLPLAQHPYEGSWGYQVTGQYAPNSRHGDGDGLRAFVDACHAAGLGVIIDFVPAHFPKDDFALALFDGTPCFEYGDPREGEHREWGTHVFNFRRPEVRNFLIAAALHWIRRFHIDGLRVDAVSSMLYRDYDRKQGEWVANEHGGNANLEAKQFLQELTSTVRREHRGVLLIAEESTAWQGVTAPTEADGLGFDLKWNMGWMHDTLAYLALDPVQRAGSHDRITFHQWYAYDDRWMLPLSHDEVVHGKRSLIDKMPGDWWRRLAQLRLLLGWQVGVPGRPLLFQGGEFGQGREFDWDRTVDWHEAKEPERAGVTAFLRQALRLYRLLPPLHARDDHRDGFQWVECENRTESVVAFLRKAPGSPDVLVACNFTPVPRHGYALGVHNAGLWRLLLNSDDPRFGGSGVSPSPTPIAKVEHRGVFPATLHIDLPPLGVVFLQAPALTS